MLFNKEMKIYVLCPAYLKTGGPELLHQLVNELNENGIESYITYYDIKSKDDNYTPDDFKRYINNYKTLNDVEDDEKNIIISPENISAIKLTKKIKKCKKILWWLSVHHFEKIYGVMNALRVYGIITTLILMIRREIIYSLNYIRKFDMHFCQSFYSMNFLERNGINNFVYLSDYINDEYLEINQSWGEKENLILYNPKKGFKFTKKIMNKAKHLNFVPLKNLTTEQVKELFLKSKVYIDFGNHPGKDRLPREAAMCGCCIITGKQGSANYYEDVPIDDEFKFNDKDENIDKIIDKIDDCLIDYNNEISKFNDYREFISNEKRRFKEDVKKIFVNK